MKSDLFLVLILFFFLFLDYLGYKYMVNSFVTVLKMFLKFFSQPPARTINWDVQILGTAPLLQIRLAVP